MTYIWAHRGASGYAPENTLQSFKLADDLGADGIELDVQLTKDGQVVVIHDETIDRTSNGRGFVKDLNLAELKALNFNNHNTKYFHCAIPTLEEVLKQVKPTRMVINIELKTGVFDYPGLVEKTIELVDKYEMGDRIIYSSFNHYTIEEVLKLRPDAYGAFLHTDKIINMAAYGKEHGVKALHPGYWFLIDPRYVTEAKENGLLINSWTINEPEYIQIALQLGINAIITNYPDVALQLRNSQ